ncbi:hypothetical protein K1T71_010249 [Dendrolimus kikuchii]|uniref:Uncharacterized protein n=1 Tax=Dendrolimus kikuchii TaxID=765133 RepID=A0ACC1CRB5_9NEOP|nr:hypothetical protein K1T71_010249 [Dendrolimus kikuchii]
MERVCVSAFFVSSEFESNENDKKRELDEMCEDRDMVELCENVEKTDIFDSEYDQELYEICTMYENLFDSEYDTNLYEICTTIENNVISKTKLPFSINKRDFSEYVHSSQVRLAVTKLSFVNNTEQHEEFSHPELRSGSSSREIYGSI